MENLRLPPIMNLIRFSLVAFLCFNVAGCIESSSQRDNPETKDRSSQINERTVVTFTPNALSKVKEFQAADGDKYVRVDVLPGFVYDMRFEDSMDKTSDILGEQSGIKILVSNKAQPYLLGSTIDWKTDASGKEGFHFENPNALPHSEAANVSR